MEKMKWEGKIKRYFQALPVFVPSTTLCIYQKYAKKIGKIIRGI